MSPRSPLPARILIPVANPGTAEELIRLGAAMLDPRAGELSALGIVEVPEGMPLSEGATRARHARRLLQKVLDYAPAGTAIHPIVRIGRHAAEGIIGGRRRAGVRPHHLRLGRQGARRPRRSQRRPDRLLADHRRGRARVPVRHRGRQAAWHARDQAGARARSAAARTPSSRSASPTRSPPTTAPRSSSSTSCRPASRWRSAPRRNVP